MYEYDDPINALRRLLTVHKDMPWTHKEMIELIPQVIVACDEMEWQACTLEEKIDDLQCHIEELTREIIELKSKLNETS